MNAIHTLRIQFFGDWLADIEKFLNLLASNLCNIACNRNYRRVTLFAYIMPMQKDINDNPP